VAVTDIDVLANVPYTPGCGLWFDHHSSEQERLDFNFSFQGASRLAPSCARVIWDYYGGRKTFPARFDSMLEYVDRCDSGNLSVEEIENPKGWILLSFIMDPRTGLGRYRDYRISNYQLREKLVEMCRNQDVETFLKDTDVVSASTGTTSGSLFRDMPKSAGRACARGPAGFRKQTRSIPATDSRSTPCFRTATSRPDHLGKLKQNTVITVATHHQPHLQDRVGALLEYGGGGMSRSAPVR
jgi:hypothetical protein